MDATAVVRCHRLSLRVLQGQQIADGHCYTTSSIVVPLILCLNVLCFLTSGSLTERDVKQDIIRHDYRVSTVSYCIV